MAIYSPKIRKFDKFLVEIHVGKLVFNQVPNTPPLTHT